MGYSQTVSINSLTPCYAKIHPCSHEIYFACTKFCLKKQNFIEFFSEYQEPIIRSNTPSNPEQKIHAEGRGAKLFRKRQGQGSLLRSSFKLWSFLRVKYHNGFFVVVLSFVILRRAHGFLHQGWQW